LPVVVVSNSVGGVTRTFYQNTEQQWHTFRSCWSRFGVQIRGLSQINMWLL